jgi:uncharacterized UPF0160 family protein
MNSPQIIIVTHDNNHHEDDVLSVAILTTIFKNYRIIRTRDPEIIEQAHFVVDVGGVYDHSQRMYDHHQNSPPCDERGHMLSSAGLIWRHYSTAYLRAINIPKEIVIGSYTIEPRVEVDMVIRNKWIYPIDMVDNGQIPGPTIISEVVNSMRAIWPEKTREKCDAQFEETVVMIRKILERRCFHIVDRLMWRTEFIGSNKTYHEDGKIMISDTPDMSGGSGYYTQEHFVISPSRTYVDEESERYTINPIKSPRGGYRTPVPDHLLGLEAEEIFKLTGITGIGYIHHNGFMMIADDVQSAITFCQYLITQAQVQE